MLYTVIITQKPNAYPNYYTYTAYEFLVISDATVRDIEMVLIDERVSTRKLRKIRNRMKAFNIVEIDMLPEDVVDVAENNTVYLPESDLHVNVIVPSSKDLKALNDAMARDEVLVTLGNEVKKLMDTTGYSSDCNTNHDLTIGLTQFFNRLGEYNTEGLRREVMDRAVRQFDIHERINKVVRRARDKMLDDCIRMQDIHLVGRLRHKHGFTAGDERRVKVKGFLVDPLPVTYFKSKIDFAEYMFAQLPITVDVRKRNALRFKICCEMTDDEVANAAASKLVQKTLLDKYR